MNIHTRTIHRSRLEVCLFIFFLHPPLLLEPPNPSNHLASLPYSCCPRMGMAALVCCLGSLPSCSRGYNVVYDDHMVKDQIAPGTCWHCLSSLLTPVCSKRVLVRTAALVPCTHPTVLRFSLVGSQGLEYIIPPSPAPRCLASGTPLYGASALATSSTGLRPKSAVHKRCGLLPGPPRSGVIAPDPFF